MTTLVRCTCIYRFLTLSELDAAPPGSSPLVVDVFDPDCPGRELHERAQRRKATA